MNLGVLGLDNVAVAFALGPLRLGPRRTLHLGLAFAVAEAGMTLAGRALGPDHLPAIAALDAARIGTLATLAVAVLGLAWIRCRPAAFVGSPAALCGLALLLGLDNLIAGASGSVDITTPAIMAMGLASGALAAAACGAGERIIGGARATGTALGTASDTAWGAAASGAMLLALAAIG